MNAFYLCAIDDGTDTLFTGGPPLGPLAAWQEVFTNSHLNACTEFCRGALDPKEAPATVLVASRAEYDRRGWPGVTVHAFVCTLKPYASSPRTDPCPLPASQDRQAAPSPASQS